MELYKEILVRILSGEDTEIIFPNLHIDPTQIVELECYKVLQKIKVVIEDDSLEDESCFKKIEEIVRAFEEVGSTSGGRHDFG